MEKGSRIEHLLGVTRRLGTLLEKEVSLLQSLRVSDIGELKEEKARLARFLEEGFKGLRKDPSLLRGLAPEARVAFKRATQELKVRAGENARALDVAREVNERLLKEIAAAIAQARNPSSAYAPHGTSAQGRSSAEAAGLPLSLDREV